MVLSDSEVFQFYNLRTSLLEACRGTRAAPWRQGRGRMAASRVKLRCVCWNDRVRGGVLPAAGSTLWSTTSPVLFRKSLGHTIRKWWISATRCTATRRSRPSRRTLPHTAPALQAGDQDGADAPKKRVGGRGRRGKPSLPPQTVEYLKSWMMSPNHIKHPYPTEQVRRHDLAAAG